MADDITFDVGMDAQGYVVGATQIAGANNRLMQSFGGLAVQTTLVQKALSLVTPQRAVMVGLGALAKTAADTQQEFAGFRATAELTGASYGKLGDQAKQLARDFPIGAQAARQVVGAFTQMGVAGSGTEAKIGKLSTTIAQLSGATGDGPQQLAEGMTNLARATGNTALDPARFAKMADSVAQVSATSGASATNILQFSKNIAPFAQSIGIGTTGVLGISGAFAKMGEDGAVASTAVSKMMSDLNRSVREGSPEMKTYAQFVGMTVGQFQELFKSNPAEALNQITESIGKAGPQGQRMLEMIGIEGVRGQRALQNVTAAGGFRPPQQTAAEAYGSGAAAKAAEQAFGGFNDSLQELTDTAHQLASALGTPLLGPLTAFTDALKVPVDAARKVAESGFVQKAIQIGAVGAIGVMAARAIVGPLGAYGLGRQLVTSSVFRSPFAGAAAGGAQPGGFAARYGAGVTRLMEEEGVAGRGPTAGLAGRLYEGSRQAAQAREARLLQQMGPAAYYDRMLAQQQGGQQSPLRRGLGTLSRGAAAVTQTYGNLLREQYANAYLPVGARGGIDPVPEHVQAAYEKARTTYLGGGGVAGGTDNAREALKNFRKELDASGSTTKAWGGAVAAHGKALYAAGRLLDTAAMDLGRGALKGAGRAAGAAMNFMGGPIGVGVAVGTSLWQLKQTIDDNNKEAAQAFQDLDISKTLNAYKESIGKATGPMTTIGTMSDQMSTQLAKATTTFEQATKVTSEDIAAATTGGKAPTHMYLGNVQQAAAQVAAIAPQGLSPDEMAAVKQDLLRQGRTTAETEAIMKALPSSAFAATGKPKVPTGSQPELTQQTFGAIANEPSSSNWAGFRNFLTSGTQNILGGGPDYSSPTSPLYASALSDKTLKSMDDLAGAIDKRFEAQSDRYGGEYAQQERFRSMEDFYKAALATGDPDKLNEASKRLTGMLGGKGAEKYIQPGAVDEAGGSFVRAFAKENDKTAAIVADWDKKREAQGGGEFQPTARPGYFSELLKNVAPTFSRAFDATQTGPAAAAFGAVKPGDPGSITAAADAMIGEQKRAGRSMSELGIEALKAADKLSDAGQEFAVVMATMQKAEIEMARQSVDQTPQQGQMNRYAYLRQVANLPPSNNAAIENKRQAADTESIQMTEGWKQRMAARLMAQYQFQIQSRRAEEDYQTTSSRAWEDYGVQVGRTIRNYNIQRTQAIQDYNKQVARAEEDYRIQQEREIRDFNINKQRAEEDFQKQRARSIRDFNIQIARQVEDAARSIYEPYSRIQTKATWDAKNLLVNLREQNDAIAKQKAQLDTLRQMGLSGQAIDQLQLGKSENAQQVNNLVQDFTKNPELVKQLNDVGAQRAGLTAGMFFDASNTELKRSQDDFKKGLDDQANDYAVSIDRSIADLRKALDDQAFDFHKTMTRTGEDFRTQLIRNEQQLAISLSDMATDMNRNMTRMSNDYQKNLNRMVEDLHNADLVMSADFKTMAEQTFNAIHGQAVDWGKLIVNDTNSFISDMQNRVVPAMNDIASQLGIHMSSGPDAVPLNAAGESASVASGIRHAEGGVIEGHSPHKKADNIHALLTAGEYVQPVDTVQYYGVDLMNKMRNRSIPKGQIEAFAKGSGDVAGDIGTPLVSKTQIIDPLAYGRMIGFSIGGSVERFMRFADGGRVGAVQDWIRQQDPKPYIWGGTGPNGFDCSGLTGAVYGLLLGKAGAGNGQRYFITTSNMEAAGLKRGHGTYTMGVSTTHTAGNLAGLAFEAASTKSGIHVGPTAKSVDSFPVQWYLPQAGDQFVGGGGAGVGNLGTVSARPRPQVDWGKAFAGLDKNKAGWYGKLRDSVMAKIQNSVNAKLDAQYGNLGTASGGGAIANMSGSPEVEKFIAAIVKQETGGEANPYASRWGKYAITPSLVNSLAMKYLGHPMSSTEYLSSPTNQDLLGRAALTSLFNQYGAKGAASSWYSGNPNLWNSTKPQPGGPSIASYVNSVLRYMGYDKGGKLAPGQTMTENATGRPEAVLTDQQWSSISQLAEQGSRMVTAEQGRQLTAAGGIHLTIDRRTINNDYRTDMTGAEITVVTSDPDEMGLKMRRKEWLSRSTQTRGVNRGA